MLDGKKAIAEKILYSILDKISKEKKMDANKFFYDVLNNVKPRVEVRSRRVGGATYQIPMEVKVDRSQALAIRWIIDAARKRSGTNMKNKLYKSITIGYWMGINFAGNGYMQDSIKNVCSFCFDDLKVNRIEAACLPKNIASKMVLIKSGFVK